MHFNNLFCNIAAAMKKFSLKSLILLFLFSLTSVMVLAKKEEPDGPKVVDIDDRVIAVAGADLEIAPKRASKTVTWTMNFLTRQDLEMRKENLIKALCKETNADVILDPQFSYSKRILGGGKLTLTGYPAKYKSFRTLTQNEIDSIVVGNNYTEGKVIIISNRPLE